MEYSNKIESIKSLIREASWTAKDCHKILFRNDTNPANKSDEILASLYLNKAIALITAAKAIYINNFEELAHDGIENIFEEFSLFECEFLECMESNHSHQHTDLKFHDFKSAYESLFGEL